MSLQSFPSFSIFGSTAPFTFCKQGPIIHCDQDELCCWVVIVDASITRTTCNKTKSEPSDLGVEVSVISVFRLGMKVLDVI
mmetsp:Transcript_9399/g.19819  ORF Transcript_9399/g.19819 Transcript_9399/m.19819 type:complete len:81 (-) Transcript_9399:215-457(-)